VLDAAQRPLPTQTPNLTPGLGSSAKFPFSNYKRKNQACPRLVLSAFCENGARCGFTHDPDIVEAARLLGPPPGSQQPLDTVIPLNHPPNT
jgi:hypothetical protein